jgi:hypothetical protein
MVFCLVYENAQKHLLANSHAAPGIRQEKGMQDSKDEVDVIKGTCEKKLGLGGQQILRSL